MSWASMVRGASSRSSHRLHSHVSFIVPNQCNDQHGRGNAGPYCNFDPNDDGTQSGLNQALMQLGDVAVKRILTAIKESPAWTRGQNAIVLLWDENDYSVAPSVNKGLLIVDTNYGPHWIQSATACESNVNVMSDLFSAVAH